MTDRPTYPELLKLFYKHSFPDQLGAPASAVAQAIIYKSNELWFPDRFTMSNKELAFLSGEKVSNIGRARQKVLDICKVAGKPMFSYVSSGQHKAGTYLINFNLTSTKLQLDASLTSTSRQKHPEIDNDPNSTLPNETKHDDDDRLPPETEEDERHDMITDALKEGIGGDPKAITLVSNQKQLDAFNEILEHKDEHILDVIDAAALKGKLHQDNALMYVRTGLRNGWYGSPGGGNGKQRMSIAEIRNELESWSEEREAVLLAPESDFTERRITREIALEQIDRQMYNLRSMMEE